MAKEASYYVQAKVTQDYKTPSPNSCIVHTGLSSKFMARWSMPNDAVIIDFTETPEKFEHDRIYIDVDVYSEAYEAKFEGDQDCRVVEVDSNEVRCSFDEFLTEFLKEVHGNNSFRPIPPMLGNKQSVDLKTLFLLVIGKGGYDAVSKNGLWDLVAEKSGLGMNIGSSTKLIYCKYLCTMETWLLKVFEGRVLSFSLNDDVINFGRQLIELQAKLRKLLSDYIAQDMGNQISRIYDFKNEYEFLDDESVTVNGFGGRKIIVKKLLSTLDAGDSSNNNEMNNVPSSSNGGNKFDSDDDVLILDPSSVNKENFGRKRKRKCVKEMLCWVTSIAKNLCDPLLCSILGRSNWSSQSTEEMKKQVLLFREAVYVKRNDESSKQHDDDWQGMKMHPNMYDDDDHLGKNCILRERMKCDECNTMLPIPNEKLLSIIPPPNSSKIHIPIDADSNIHTTQSPHIEVCAVRTTHLAKCTTVPIPKGAAHQALVPEWIGVTLKSDPKWLGTQIWPLKIANHRLVIEERDVIGEGRDDFCSCQVPGSMECVKSHITERRAKVKSELGEVFYQWYLDKVGEDVSHYWTYEEEKKFKDVLKSNVSSQKKCLWDRMFTSFPKKSRIDLVNYYFNVFVLRRRRFQNLHSPNNIDSDDDQLEAEPLIKPKIVMAKRVDDAKIEEMRRQVETSLMKLAMGNMKMKSQMKIHVLVAWKLLILLGFRIILPTLIYL